MKKTSKKCCKIARSSKRHLMEAMMVQGIPNRKIARAFGFSEPTVRRHRNEHLPKEVVSDLDKPMDLLANIKEVQRQRDIESIKKEVFIENQGPEPIFEDLAGWLKYARERTIKILNRAERKGEYGLALGALKELRGNLELMVRGSELLLARNSAVDTERVINVVLAVLAPYPELKQEIASVLRQYKL